MYITIPRSNDTTTTKDGKKTTDVNDGVRGGEKPTTTTRNNRTALPTHNPNPCTKNDLLSMSSNIPYSLHPSPSIEDIHDEPLSSEDEDEEIFI